MKTLPDRFCARECIKDGEAHNFTGRVKLVLVEPTAEEERMRNTGAAFVAVANLMIGGNLGIMFVYALSFKLPWMSSAHALLCTTGTQFCLPLSILLLHSLNGASASMKQDQRRLEHIFLSLMSVTLGVCGCLVLFQLDSKECWAHVHVYIGCAAGVAAVASIISGYFMFSTKNELESPFVITFLHRFFGMITLVLSALSYMTSLYGEGGCKSNFKMWLYTIGFQGPLFLVYFLIIFYTFVVLFIPGSKFAIRTKYNC